MECFILVCLNATGRWVLGSNNFGRHIYQRQLNKEFGQIYKSLKFYVMNYHEGHGKVLSRDQLIIYFIALAISVFLDKQDTINMWNCSFGSRYCRILFASNKKHLTGIMSDETLTVVDWFIGYSLLLIIKIHLHCCPKQSTTRTSGSSRSLLNAVFCLCHDHSYRWHS